MGGTKMIRAAAINLNGISIAYVMGFVNAVFAMLVAYGITLTDAEIGATTTLINAGMILAVHFGHRVGEATASGSSMAHSVTANESVEVAAARRAIELRDAEAMPPDPPPPTPGA